MQTNMSIRRKVGREADRNEHAGRVSFSRVGTGREDAGRAPGDRNLELSSALFVSQRRWGAREGGISEPRMHAMKKVGERICVPVGNCADPCRRTFLPRLRNASNRADSCTTVQEILNPTQQQKLS